MGYSCAVLHRPSMLCRMKWSCMGHTLILNGFGAGKCCATNEKKSKRKKKSWLSCYPAKECVSTSSGFLWVDNMVDKWITHHVQTHSSRRCILLSSWLVGLFGCEGHGGVCVCGREGRVN